MKKKKIPDNVRNYKLYLIKRRVRELNVLKSGLHSEQENFLENVIWDITKIVDEIQEPWDDEEVQT